MHEQQCGKADAQLVKLTARLCQAVRARGRAEWGKLQHSSDAQHLHCWRHCRLCGTLTGDPDPAAQYTLPAHSCFQPSCQATQKLMLQNAYGPVTLPSCSSMPAVMRPAIAVGLLAAGRHVAADYHAAV